MVMIIQLETGKCEQRPVDECRRLWFALTGEKRGRAGDKKMARRIKRWFFPPDKAPASFQRRQAIEAGVQPELTDRELPWWHK